MKPPWRCEWCGFQSRWWKGCEQFKLCTTCDRVDKERQRLEVVPDPPATLFYADVEPVLGEKWDEELREKVLWYIHGPGAMLCLVAGEERWVPFSLIGPDSEVKEVGDSGELEIREWFAIKEHWPECRCEHGLKDWHRLPDYSWCYGPFRHG